MGPRIAFLLFAGVKLWYASKWHLGQKKLYTSLR